MDKLKALLKAVLNRETITYVLFGGLTTLVNLLVFKGFDLLLPGRLYLLSNALAWVAAVAFAFVTNKAFVFESRSWRSSVLKKEIPGFVGARLGSLLVEEGGLRFFVEVLGFGTKVFDFIVVRLSGKIVAKLTSPFQDRVETAKSLFGCIPDDITLQEAREERLNRI